MDYQSILEEIYTEVKALENKGKVADYIPELAKVDPNKFAISLITTSGEKYSVGNYNDAMSIQSISKVFALALAFEKLGEAIWDRIDVEPSGNAFNSLVQLETEQGIPRNPFINAGAIVVTDILTTHFKDPVRALLNLIGNTLGHTEIGYDKDVALSELEHCDLNKALAYFMKSFKNIENDVDKVIEIYARQCSIQMSCEQLAASFLLFANQGFSIHSQQQILPARSCKRINALMQTCGSYDEAGEFAFEVGLPAKSGVGGGIAAVLPNKFSVAVWSPGLNAKGNSWKGLKALELLTTKLGASLF